jgi:RNA polymerase sigma-70 factor (ECF subfamily)
MSEAQREFESLIQRLQEGCQDAAWELIVAYGSCVQRVIRRSLGQRMRTKFDSLDFVQAVWASVFRDRDQFDAFKGPDNLIEFLVTVARNKVLMEHRRRTRMAKYDINRERSLDEAYYVGEGEGIEHPGPRPSEVAIVRERWNTLMERQSPLSRRVVELRLAGMTYDEIANELSISERTARRVVDRLLSEHSA